MHSLRSNISPWVGRNFMMAHNWLVTEFKSRVFRILEVKPNYGLCFWSYACFPEGACVKGRGRGSSECYIQILDYSLPIISFQLCLRIHFLHIHESISLWKSDRHSTKNSWMWILEAAGHSMEICFQGFTLSSGKKKQLEEIYKISMLVQQRHPMDVDMRKLLITLIPTTRLVVQRCTGCIFR